MKTYLILFIGIISQAACAITESHFLENWNNEVLQETDDIINQAMSEIQEFLK
jgi:hypothetical protein